MTSRVDAWLAAALADADARGLPELKPLLEGLARSTAALREADAQTTVTPTPNAPDDAGPRPDPES